MKGVDYTKQLAKEREYFNDSLKKTKEAAERRIADTNERAEFVKNKQRENFIEDKTEMESSYQKNLNQLNNITRQALDNNNDKNNEDLQKERESFTKDSIAKRKDFDQRLNDIKNSYEKSFQSERDIHDDLQKSSRKKYQENVGDIRKDFDTKLSEFNDEMTKEGHELKDSYNRERQQLVRSHENSMRDVQKDASHKRAEQRDRLRDDFQKSKKIQESDFEQQKQYAGDRMATMQNKYENRYQNMAKDYSQRSDQLVENQQREYKKTNREHQGQLMDARRDYNKQLRLIELEKRRRNNGSGEFADVMNRQQGLQDQSMKDGRVEKLKERMAEVQRQYQEKTLEDKDKFNDSMRVESTEATVRLDRQKNEMNSDKIITVARERERAEAQVANRENQNRIDRATYEQRLIFEKNSANERLTNLKENFTKSMKQLEDKHRASMEGANKVNHDDKAEFIKKMNEARNKEIYDIKREFARLIDSTVNEYEQRLANYQRDNEYLKMTMDQKVENILDQTDKKIDSQEKFNDDRRSADLKNYQMIMDQKDSQYKNDITQMNANYQRKIDQMQVASDTKIKLITNDYENKLKDIKVSTSKELAQKDTIHQMELDRIKATYEEEKNRLVSTYENRLDSVREDHQNQMTQMKEFKRLS